MSEKPTYESLEQRVLELEKADSKLKQAEVLLRESEEKFRRFFMNAPLPYQSLDENGNFIEVNSIFLETLGYSREEVIGKNFGALLHPDWVAHFKENFPRFKAIGEVMGIEFEMVKKDGSTITVSFNGKKQLDDQGQFQRTHCIFQDITKPKQGELELKDAEQKWRNILINTPQIGISLDPQGKIVFANAHFLKLTGWMEHEVIGQDWFAMFIPEHISAEMREVFKETMAQKDIKGFSANENEIVTKSGELLNVEWSNVLTKDAHRNVLDVTCLGIDITEQKRTYEKLRESEQRYRTFIDSTTDLVFLKDNNFCYVLINIAYGKFLGFSEKEVTGKTDFDLMPLQAAQSCRESDLRAIEYQEVVVSQEQMGDNFFETLKFPVQLPDRKMGVGGFLRNITARKQVEAALNESQNIIEGIVHSIPVRVFWKNKNLVYLGCNAIFARDAGFNDPKDIIGKDDYQMVWRDQAELYRNDDRHVIESGCSKLFVEEPQTTPDGKTITLLTSKIPLSDHKGRTIGVLGTYMDITERKRAEEEIERYSTELEKNNKELQKALSEVKQLSGLLPICSYCKKIRDDKGYWNQIESYIHEHSEAKFSHGICQECAKVHYPDLNLYDE